MTAGELLITMWHRVPRPIRALYGRIGFGIRPLVRRFVTDERRPVRITAGLLRGMYVNVHLRSEHKLIAGDAELDVQLPLPRLVAPGMCAYNVGANYGFFTLALARLVGPSGRVIAFEPNPPVVARLRENVAINHLTNVKVEPVAVSDVAGTLRFALAGDFESHLIAGEPAAGEVITVDSTTIDAYVASGSPPPDVIIMDVEDAEGLALRGARATLHQHQPAMIIEIHSSSSGADVMAELAQVGYVLAELPAFKRVGSPSEIRPRGHYCAALPGVLPPEPVSVPDTVAGALEYLGREAYNRTT